MSYIKETLPPHPPILRVEKYKKLGIEKPYIYLNGMYVISVNMDIGQSPFRYSGGSTYGSAPLPNHSCVFLFIF